MGIYYIIAMDQIYINQIVVGIFLLITLFVGLRGKRASSMEGYALADRSLPTSILLVTVMATLIAQGTLDRANNMYHYGLVNILADIANFICFLFIGFFVAPRIIRYKSCLTIGDIMHRLYGNEARILTGLASATFSVLVVSMHINAIGIIAHDMLGLPIGGGIVILGTVVVLYACFGGMRSVAFTDVIQFLAFMFVFVLLANVLCNKCGGIRTLLQNIPGEKLTFTGHDDFFYKVRSAIFWYLYPTFVLSPPIVQRVLMIKKPKTAKNIFFISAIVLLILSVIIAIIGLGTHVLQKQGGIAPIVFPKQSYSLILYLIQDFFKLNIFLKPMLMIGLLSVIISTMDSFLLTSGVSFVQDVIKPFRQVNEIKYARYMTFIIGMTAIGVNYAYTDINMNPLYGWAFVVYSALQLPFIAGVMGLKGEKKALFFSLGVFVVTKVVLYKLNLHMYSRWLIATILSGITFFATHYMVNNGFVMVDTNTNSLRIKGVQRGFFKTISSYITLLPKRTQNQLEISEDEPFFFSLFILFFSTIMLISPDISDSFWVISVHFINTVLCTGILLKSVWPKKLKPHFAIYWLTTLLHCLPFGSTLFFLHNPSSSSTILYICISLVFLTVLVDWSTFCLISSLGTILGLITYKLSAGVFYPALTFATKWNLVLGAIATFIAVWVFARKNQINRIQQKYNLTQKNEETTNHLQIQQEAHHQLASSLDPRSSMISEMQKSIAVLESQKADQQQLDKLKNVLEHFKTDTVFN